MVSLRYSTYSQLYDACVSPIINDASGVRGQTDRSEVGLQYLYSNNLTCSFSERLFALFETKWLNDIFIKAQITNIYSN